MKNKPTWKLNPIQRRDAIMLMLTGEKLCIVASRFGVSSSSILKLAKRYMGAHKIKQHNVVKAVKHSYALHGEDLLALEIFARMGIDKPSYLDIGAYHPFEISNTALLYEFGCRGINVEANPGLIGAFFEHRPEDINVCIAVGPVAGQGKFNLQHSSLLPFDDPEFLDVGVVTITAIVDQYAGGVFPDFLNIDIEGLDLAVLKTIDYSRSAPKVICAEEGTDASGEYVHIGSELVEHLKPWYKPAYRTGNNLFLVRNETFMIDRNEIIGLTLALEEAAATGEPVIGVHGLRFLCKQAAQLIRKMRPDLNFIEDD